MCDLENIKWYLRTIRETSVVQSSFGQQQNSSMSVLFHMTALCHSWLLTTWNIASTTEFIITFNLNNTETWFLMVKIKQDKDLSLVLPLSLVWEKAVTSSSKQMLSDEETSIIWEPAMHQPELHFWDSVKYKKEWTWVLETKVEGLAGTVKSPQHKV